MKNEWFIEKFENYLVGQNSVTSNTITSYMLDICKVFRYLENKSIIDFTQNRNDVEEFLANLKNNGYSQSTSLRMLSTINKFNDFLYDDRLIENKIKLDFKLEYVDEKKDLVIFSREDINKILDIENTTFLGLRDKAIFELVYAIGIKATDAINLLVENVNLEIGYLKYNDSKNNSNVVPINSIALDSIKAYIDKRKELDVKSDYLFVSSKSKPISRQCFWKIFKKRGEEVGLFDELTPTNFRNTLAAHLLEEGIAPEDVKELLGLKSITSLQNYIYKINKERRINRILENHPRNSI